MVTSGESVGPCRCGGGTDQHKSMMASSIPAVCKENSPHSVRGLPHQQCENRVVCRRKMSRQQKVGVQSGSIALSVEESADTSGLVENELPAAVAGIGTLGGVTWRP